MDRAQFISDVISVVLFLIVGVADFIMASALRQGKPWRLLYLGNPKVKATGEYLYEIKKWRYAASWFVRCIGINALVTALATVLVEFAQLFPTVVLMVMLYLHGAWLILSTGCFMAYCDNHCYTSKKKRIA